MPNTAEKLKLMLEAGGKKNPFWIIGPCVIESRELVARIADKLVTLSQKHQIPVVFKASFDKANRTSHQSFRGQGVDSGLETLAWVKSQFGLPVLTGIHETHQAKVVAEVADILQIPAFLCRQTDLLQAACATGRLVNVKKGQFLAPSNVAQLIGKLQHFQASGFWVTERGVSFGYQRLVVDFAAFPEMEAAGAPSYAWTSPTPFNFRELKGEPAAGFAKPSRISRERGPRWESPAFSPRRTQNPRKLYPTVPMRGRSTNWKRSWSG